jgi:hypothetical protein
MKIRLSINAASGSPATFEHSGPVIRVGRDPECELSLQGENASAVSRQHARIELRSAGATLTDTGSSNGTLLNGKLLEGPAPLRVGDRFQMGFTGATLTVQELDLATPSANNILMRRAALIGAPALIAVAAFVVIGVVVLRKPKEREGHAHLPPTQPPAGIRPPDTTPPNNAQPPPDERGKHPAPPPPPPPKVAAVQEVKEVGSYVALDQWVSVLLRREGEGYPWVVLRPESRVSTAQTLVSLPGYRSLITLDSGAHLTLWGNLPEFSGSPPVLESVVMLHAPAAGTDLDFTLDRGRVVIANRKSPAAPVRVRLRFLGEVWQLELPDDRSEVALELWGLPRRPPDGKDGAPPPTCLGLFTKGRVHAQTPRQTLDLGDHSRLSWLNQDAATVHRTDLPGLPDWWAKPPDRKAPAVQKALRSLLDWSDILGGSNTNPAKRPAGPAGVVPVVTAVKTQVKEVKDPDNQDVGVFFLAALDEVEPLVDLLEYRENPNVRGATLFALQTWLSRGGRRGEELARILEKRGSAKDKAELIVRLLHFYPPEALDDRKTYEELVGRLSDAELLVRDLAFWHLDQLGVGGRLPAEAKRIKYDPAGDAETRREAVDKWKKLLADRKVPVLPRR